MAAVRSRWIPEGGYTTRAGGAWFFTGVVFVVVALVVAGALLEWSESSIAVVLTALTAAQLGWAIFWRPRLVVSEEDITVVNPWRTDVVPWSALVNVDTRFHLTLMTRDRSVQAQGAPGPGGIKALRAAGRPSRDSRAWHLEGLRPGDEVNTDSGGAAAVVRGHWSSLVEAGVLGPEEPVRGDWDKPVVLVAAAGALLSAAAWLALLL